MGKVMKNEFEPDYISLPGQTVLETITALGMSQAELAERTGRPTKTISEIVTGKTKITPETAIQLERVLGVPASFWNNRQRRYDEYQARCQEHAQLRSQLEWLGKFPVTMMRRLGWLKLDRDKIQQLQELLSFFGVASPETWEDYQKSLQVAYRKSNRFRADRYALAVWLRKGELTAQKIDCAPYDRSKFRQVLQTIRSLTVEPPDVFQQQVIELCASCGVATAFVPELPKTCTSGVTRWLTQDKAILQLSLRYKTDDHLWFTFFHEAAHIILHQKKSIFLEDGHCGGDHEAQANAFAAEILVPQKALKAFAESQVLSSNSIRQFARQQGIAPGIVVGRLQHEKYLKYFQSNELKQKFRWAE